MDVYVYGNYAYLADCVNGLQVVDISYPFFPVIIGNVGTPGSAFGIFAEGGYAYVADSIKGICKIDISDPNKPIIEKNYDTNCAVYDVSISDRYAYAACGESGLCVIKIKDPPTWYRDLDGDGFGDPNYAVQDPNQPAGYVPAPFDCDDADPDTYPGALEQCDDKDNDCNGIIDDPNKLDYNNYYRDADYDGYGDLNNSQYECKQPPGYISNSEDHDDTDPAINPSAEEIYDGKDNNCDGEVDEHCYFTTNLKATGQKYHDSDQTADVQFGLDSTKAWISIEPNNWSSDDIVRLQLIDPFADNIDDPNSFIDDDYLVYDVREASGQTQISWYIMVEISDMADPDIQGYYPELTWDPNELGCTIAYGTNYVYQLRKGLGNSGDVLVDNMLTKDSYQTTSQDGEKIQYFTILWCAEPPPPPPRPPRPTLPPILPWPGMYPGGLFWPSIPMNPMFSGGTPVSVWTGYPAGISRPSFPGTFPGLAYPGGLYPSVPSFHLFYQGPWIFPPGGINWPGIYWNGFSDNNYGNNYGYHTMLYSYLFSSI